LTGDDGRTHLRFIRDRNGVRVYDHKRNDCGDPARDRIANPPPFGKYLSRIAAGRGAYKKTTSDQDECCDDESEGKRYNGSSLLRGRNEVIEVVIS
jgi:hypothetical protein